MTATLISFTLCLIVFAVIGIWSSRHQRGTSEDYLLAGRQVRPWLSGLSAVSTTCSGFMFFGLIGLTWKLGIYSFWFMAGMVIANLFCWHKFVGPFHAKSKDQGVKTIPEFLAKGKGGRSPTTQRLAGVLIILFLGLYAAMYNIKEQANKYSYLFH